MIKIAAKIGTGILCLIVTASPAQSPDSPAGKVSNIPGKWLDRISSKTAALNGQLTRQTEHYLKRMARRESQLERRLSAVDSTGAKTLFAGSAQRYTALERQIALDTGNSSRSLTGIYQPYLDSLQGSIKFLGQHGPLSTGPANGQVQGAASQVQTLEAKMEDADQVKAFLQQRKQQIAQYLAQHTGLQPLLGKSMAGINQDVYYYGQQLRQYKELWSNPDQLEQKLLSLLNRLPAFQTFMKENSMLGGLFNLPGTYGAPQAISGLQTRNQIAQLIQNQVSAGGAGGAQALQSNLQSAESQLDGYKSKLNQLGSSNGDMDMPGFKPNDQKTKTFWKRLQYGTDIQTTRNNYFFPTITDLGLSVGYNLGHNNIIGAGASYKIGWGNGIQHIAFTSQGAGLRTFLQIKIKGSFSATGGFELNYTQPFRSYQKLKQLQYWTKSGLVGVTKTIAVKSKVFKHTSMSLLWDFLSYQQIPQVQPILFRVGYVL